jgi:hypothetical protein
MASLHGVTGLIVMTAAIKVTNCYHCSLPSNWILSNLSQLFGTINLMQFKTIFYTSFEVLTVVAM